MASSGRIDDGILDRLKKFRGDPYDVVAAVKAIKERDAEIERLRETISGLYATQALTNSWRFWC